MDLKQLLTMLQGVSGPNASGEYTAKCPAHQDRTASLTATVKTSGKDGKDRIYLCCHAGCPGADIMAALGITAKDLIVNPDPAARGKTSGSAAKAQRKTGGAAKAQRDESVDPETGEIVHGVTVHQAKEIEPPPQAEKDQLIPDWDHPDRVYSYTISTIIVYK